MYYRYKNHVVVFFDLETTGLNTNTCEVLQIAARCGNLEYSAYIMPSDPIPWEATEVNGLSICSCCGGHLCLEGEPVDTVEPDAAWYGLLNFLKKNCNGQRILVAHNGKRFDFPLLRRDASEFGLLHQFQSAVWGTVDFRDPLRNRMPYWQGPLRLTSVAKHQQVDISRAHDGIGDCIIMDELCDSLDIYAGDLVEFAENL